MKNLSYLIIIVILITPEHIFSQQVISSGGTHVVGTNVQLSWTVGEPITETFSITNGILTQGFHQGKLTVTVIEPDAFNGITLFVYPNPVVFELILDISGTGKTNLVYHMYNTEGKLLVNKITDNQSEKINMQNYPSGTYLLKVFSNEKQSLRTFKVLKN